MLIERGCLKRNCLSGQTVLITGGGGGIAVETARALVWLGADVILAEVDEERGCSAARVINREAGGDKAHFYPLDLGCDDQIDALYTYVAAEFGALDVLFNNATVAPFGAVDDVAMGDWDRSYAVNLRAPVRLVQKFLPDMKKRGRGTVVFVPSSGAAPFMGAYEVFKTAQVELCNTLAGELEETGVLTYAIGPGLVKTETARRGIEKVAYLMNMSTDDFYRMNESKMLDAEAAGTGFAVSVALAERYNGQEISSLQALTDAKIIGAEPVLSDMPLSDGEESAQLREVLGRVAATYREQSDGWLSRNVFERQWILRDFKKTVGMSVDAMNIEVGRFEPEAGTGGLTAAGELLPLLEGLKKYYGHQHKLLQGYEKDPKKLREGSETILSWLADLDLAIGHCKRR